MILSIEEAFEREVEATKKMLHPGEELTALTVQNIQARLRAERMWNWSNAVSGLFLQTGNMSEKAAGYTTIEMCIRDRLTVATSRLPSLLKSATAAP